MLKLSWPMRILLVLITIIASGAVLWTHLLIGHIKELIVLERIQEAERHLQTITFIKDRSFPKKWRAKIFGLHADIEFAKGNLSLGSQAFTDEVRLLVDDLPADADAVSSIGHLATRSSENHPFLESVHHYIDNTKPIEFDDSDLLLPPPDKDLRKFASLPAVLEKHVRIESLLQGNYGWNQLPQIESLLQDNRSLLAELRESHAWEHLDSHCHADHNVASNSPALFLLEFVNHAANGRAGAAVTSFEMAGDLIERFYGEPDVIGCFIAHRLIAQLAEACEVVLDRTQFSQPELVRIRTTLTRTYECDYLTSMANRSYQNAKAQLARMAEQSKDPKLAALTSSISQRQCHTLWINLLATHRSNQDAILPGTHDLVCAKLGALAETWRGYLYSRKGTAAEGTKAAEALMTARAALFTMLFLDSPNMLPTMGPLPAQLANRISRLKNPQSTPRTRLSASDHDQS